jgi:uncharacterized protein YecE (DUF72 family)
MSNSALSTQHSALHIGTAGWNYRDWAGNFYPEGISDSKEMLDEYVKRFKTVELDSTFYGIPRPNTVADWHERTPPDFIFAAKFPRVITHDKKLFDTQAETDEFLTTMAALGAKMGPFVLQFPYSFKPTEENYAALETYVAALPPTTATNEDGTVHPYRYAVEVRHKGWLDNKLYNILRFHNIALALTSSDAPWMPRYMDVATTDFVYMRWLGDLQEPITVRDRSEELQKWAEIAKKLLTDGHKVWGYFNNQWAGHAPTSTEEFIELVNALCRSTTPGTMTLTTNGGRRAAPAACCTR